MVGHLRSAVDDKLSDTQMGDYLDDRMQVNSRVMEWVSQAENSV